MPIFKLCKLIQNHLLVKRKKKEWKKVIGSPSPINPADLFFLFLYLKTRFGRSQAPAVATQELVQAVALCAVPSRMG
jgi:hypothetical protein